MEKRIRCPRALVLIINSDMSQWHALTKTSVEIGGVVAVGYSGRDLG